MIQSTKLSLPVAVLSSLLIATCYANVYDPHVYPVNGPFFEGWYARITDSDNERSLGVLFGRVLPKPNSPLVNPMTYLSLIRSKGHTESMEVVDIFPAESDISVTVRGGHEVTTNPDVTSPPYFEWIAKPYGYFNVTPNSTVFDFKTSEVRFNGSFGKPVKWSSNGEGPEGWLRHLPFIPLHWFVYSLATPGNYTWTNLVTTTDRISGKGTMHQEKNWGDSFPPSWIWTEGTGGDTTTTSSGVAYAGSFGVIEIGPLTIPAHLYGYRNYNKNISLDFRPDNSYTSTNMDACLGKFSVVIRSIRYKVEINIVAPPSTLGKCLYGPTVTGFLPVCVESYVATTETVVYKLTYSGYEKIDYSFIKKAALEFGGGYICSSGPC